MFLTMTIRWILGLNSEAQTPEPSALLPLILNLNWLTVSHIPASWRVNDSYQKFCNCFKSISSAGSCIIAAVTALNPSGKLKTVKITSAKRLTSSYISEQDFSFRGTFLVTERILLFTFCRNCFCNIVKHLNINLSLCGSNSDSWSCPKEWHVTAASWGNPLDQFQNFW